MGQHIFSPFKFQDKSLTTHYSVPQPSNSFLPLNETAQIKQNPTHPLTPTLD